MPVGSYDLFVGGVFRASISVVDNGTEIEGEIEFDSDPDDPGEILLDFDPDGATIEILQGAAVFFSDTFTAASGGPAAVAVPKASSSCRCLPPVLIPTATPGALPRPRRL